jgi:uncharacterized protein with GYD domain
MPTYIMLMTLTPEGQAKAVHNSHFLLDEEQAIQTPGVQTLGVYAVLGHYDFVTLVEAESNDCIARFSIELGVKAGVHITTLPVIPAARLEVEPGGGDEPLETRAALDQPRSQEAGNGPLRQIIT